MTYTTLNEFIRATTAQDYIGTFVDSVESMPREDKLKAEQIVRAYARALGYSVKVFILYDQQYRIDISDDIGRTVFCTYALTYTGAFIWSCRKIAKRVKARNLSELQMKVDLI